MANFEGTAGSDTIIGSNSPDFIHGRRGGDLIFGYGDGSGLGGIPPAIDPAGGGALDDDKLFGDGGSDTLHGGGGGDTIRGRWGRDQIFGDNEADRLFGGAGTDTLHGGADSDTLQGGGRKDRLHGDDGDDRLVGGRGDDVLDGGTGVDTAVFAGNIDDYQITTVAGVTTVRDLAPALAGNDGTDTLTTIEQLQFADGVVTLAFSIDLATLTADQGFVIYGTDPNDYSGLVSSAGDVNGDGFDDLIVAAPRAYAADNAKNDAGESYVIFGSDAGFGASLDLATLASSQGFVIYGADAYDGSGSFSVSSAGDVNGDGFDDLIIGAPRADAAGNAKYAAGESYVIFGTDAGFGPNVDLAALTPSQGFVIYGADEADYSGDSVSSAGDVNGDGFDDLIIGAYGAGVAGNAKFQAGESYVIFGADAGFGASLDLATLTAAQGFVIYGADATDRSGSVSSAGDVNGDGFDDLIVGAPNADAAGNMKYGAGESYVVFGTDAGFGASLDLATLTAAQGFVIYGADAGDGLGGGSSAGDVNGDGFDDLIVGAVNGDAAGNGRPYAGESYVIFGTDAGFGASIDLATLTAAQGFVIYGADAYDHSGTSVSSAGDVNGDGFDDLILGAPAADAADNATVEAGRSYVIFGTDAGFGASIDLAALTPSQGFVIYGIDVEDFSGSSVSSAGDLNGDGFDDLIVGAPLAEAAGDAKFRAGESYVIYGGDFTGGAVFAGTSGADTLTDTAAKTLADGSGAAFQAGDADDTVAVSSLDFLLVDGGKGTDTLRLDGAGLTLDLTALADKLTRGIEQIDLTGTGNNTLKLGMLDLLNLSDESNELLVKGNAGDRIDIGAGWATGGTTNVAGQTYQIYTDGAAVLKVDTDIALAEA